MPKVENATNSKASTKLEEFKNNCKAVGETLVVEDFPKNVLEIDALVSSSLFQLQRIPEFRVELNVPIPEPLTLKEEDTAPATKRRRVDKVEQNSNAQIEGTKVIAFVSGMVPSNQKIMELIGIVKPVVRDAVENVNKVKMWILLMIPRIEDGNNFGVSIQEETLAEVRAVEAEAASFLDQISRYLTTRGKIVSKVAKYPHVEDYRNAVTDLDEKEFLNLRLVLMELRNHYSTLHDMIMKNFEKIKKPRTTNMEHIY